MIQLLHVFSINPVKFIVEKTVRTEGICIIALYFSAGKLPAESRDVNFQKKSRDVTWFHNFTCRHRRHIRRAETAAQQHVRRTRAPPAHQATTHKSRKCTAWPVNLMPAQLSPAELRLQARCSSWSWLLQTARTAPSLSLHDSTSGFLRTIKCQHPLRAPFQSPNPHGGFLRGTNSNCKKKSNTFPTCPKWKCWVVQLNRRPPAQKIL
jgi:hypothetical protein